MSAGERTGVCGGEEHRVEAGSTLRTADRTQAEHCGGRGHTRGRRRENPTVLRNGLNLQGLPGTIGGRAVCGSGQPPGRGGRARGKTGAVTRAQAGPYRGLWRARSRNISPGCEGSRRISLVQEPPWLARRREKAFPPFIWKKPPFRTRVIPNYAKTMPKTIRQFSESYLAFPAEKSD